MGIRARPPVQMAGKSQCHADLEMQPGIPETARIRGMFFVINAREWPSPDVADLVWQHLWELREVTSVVVPTVVSSPCSLLAEEHADTVCLSTGMQVPQGSAWVSRPIDLARFVDRNGDIRIAALDQALADCVDSGDALHDATPWGSPAIQSDSWLNRRLAIAVRGWGSVVALRGSDPGKFTTLRELEGLATHVHATLENRSRTLAKERGHCPSLDAEEARISRRCDDTLARWKDAVAAHAIRHRNLLMMSPWDVFPARQPANLRYADLLPLLRCANSLSFQCDVDISHWNVKEFRRFYERVGAILGQDERAGLVAKQV